MTPTPTPTPTPTTPTVNFNDTEYQRSGAALAANALTAYNAGATGTGIKIGILDSGLADPLGEFTGRIDPASRDIAGNRGIVDTDGHGTSVAAVAAAGRNGSQIEGVAFNATLVIERTDDPGSCANDGKCNHSVTNLATAMDAAVAAGARVINMSLGGAPAGTALTNAIGRATAAGVIVVISAGNDATADPDQLAQVASTAAARGLVIIAGANAVAADGSVSLSTFSDQAGAYAAFYLTALGTRVRAFDHTGQAFLFSGTSYSAPAIAGAAALLAGAFPNLTGAQIVALLYSTATDAGAAGVDATYGHGILNLTRAFQPQNGTSLAGSKVAVSLVDNATLSTAMGDATGAHGAGLGGAVILDGYSRAYALNLAATMRSAAVTRPLVRAIGGDVRSTGFGSGRIAVSLTVSRDRQGTPWAGLAQLGLTRDDSRRARAMAGMALAQIDERSAAAFGFGESGHALAAQLEGSSDLPFLAARRPGDEPGFETRGGTAFAFRHALGRIGLSVSAEQGEVAALTPRSREPGFTTVHLAADRRFGPLSLSAGGGVLRESATVLGARFGAVLGSGATTRLVDIGAALDPGGGWRLGASWRKGWTRADGGTASLGDGRLASSAFAVDVIRTGLLARSDRFGVRLAQPLRVSSGGYWLNLPISYDYATGAIGYEARRLDLAPAGRERDAELTYGRKVGYGWIDANLYLRSQPGNYAAAPDDLGTALRFTMAF